MAEQIGRTLGKEKGGVGEENRAGTVGLREASAGWPVDNGHLGPQGPGEGGKGKIAWGHLEEKGRGKKTG